MLTEQKRIALARELLKERVERRGQGTSENIEALTNLPDEFISGTPESTLIWILEAIWKNVQAGDGQIGMWQILEVIEGSRSNGGEDENRFRQIVEVGRGEKAQDSVLQYCAYRLEIEHPDAMLNDLEIQVASGMAMNEISAW